MSSYFVFVSSEHKASDEKNNLSPACKTIKTRGCCVKNTRSGSCLPVNDSFVMTNNLTKEQYVVKVTRTLICVELNMK